jgi:hypothetical protein
MPTRNALVIGNSHYTALLPDGTRGPIGPELSGVRDGQDLTAALQGIHGAGFDVTFVADADYATLKQALDDFGVKINGPGDALFYFSGHGFHFGIGNYLQPTDAYQVDTDKLAQQVIALDRVFDTLSRAQGTKVIVLDACRDSAFGDPAQVGFTQPANTPQQTLIAYAAQFGEQSQDGQGQNSPFTGALVRSIREPGLEIADLFARVSGEVQAMTQANLGRRQTPIVESSLTGPFYFCAAVVLQGTIDQADDDLIVALNGEEVLTWSKSHSETRDLVLRAGDNSLVLTVFNQKTFEGGNIWGKPEGWSYKIRWNVRGAGGAPLAVWQDSEDTPVRDGPHQGTSFTVARATVRVDPQTALLSLWPVDLEVWKRDLPPPASPPVTLFEKTLAVYDDSWQVESAIPFKMKALRHELTFSIFGAEDLRQAVSSCAGQPTVANGLASAAAVFRTQNDFGPLRDALAAALSNCVGGALRVALDDQSHWVDLS